MDHTYEAGHPPTYCRACGARIDPRAEICPHCGVRQAGVARPRGQVGEKSKIAAGILALFLGGIGVHKFYLGRPGQGVLYLLFCWTLIPSLIAFIEGIIYLTMNDEAFAAKYG